MYKRFFIGSFFVLIFSGVNAGRFNVTFTDFLDAPINMKEELEIDKNQRDELYNHTGTVFSLLPNELNIPISKFALRMPFVANKSKIADQSTKVLQGINYVNKYIKRALKRKRGY